MTGVAFPALLTAVSLPALLAYAMAGSIIVLVMNRLVVGGILGASAFRRRVLVLGAGDRAKRLQDLSDRPESGFVIVGNVAMTESVPVIEQAIARSAINNLTQYV